MLNYALNNTIDLNRGLKPHTAIISHVKALQLANFTLALYVNVNLL